MTATPIPRTLTMTVYGDLDLSELDEMPRGRGKIITAVRDSAKLGDVLSFLRTQLEASRQVYVVYPLIEESEKLEAKAAAAEYDRRPASRSATPPPASAEPGPAIAGL